MTSMTVNGKPVRFLLEPETPLLWALRDAANLTGTKYGCGEGDCGACMVHVDGEALRSCLITIAEAEGRFITTIEGLADGNGLHPVQDAFWEEHGLQCGFCTPGMIITAVDLLDRNPDPSEHEIREALEGNLCRCTGYQNIVKAVKYAAQKIKG